MPPSRPSVSPLVKWSGGKRSEIPFLKPAYPKGFTRLVEPFSGGAAVALDANPDRVVLNDVSVGLVDFYRAIQDPARRAQMLTLLGTIDTLRKHITATVVSAPPKVVNGIFEQPAPIKGTKKAPAKPATTTPWSVWVDSAIATWVGMVPTPLQAALTKDLRANLHSKAVVRIPNLQIKAGRVFDLAERRAHLETAFQSGVYTTLRRIYNAELTAPGQWATAAWYAVRSLCYSGMFRYGKTGAFNVPYGGIAYNSRNFATSIAQLSAADVVDVLGRSDINSLDFEQLFAQYNGFEATDFIFVDPPYDSAFSQYNKEEDFTQADQKRLAKLLTKTKAPWMLVIKNTPFILGLYDAPHLHKGVFSKSYQVNFRNRNAQGVEHLVVTNYPFPPEAISPTGAIEPV